VVSVREVAGDALIGLSESEDELSHDTTGVACWCEPTLEWDDDLGGFVVMHRGLAERRRG
jgi:hypothetical protein